MTQKKPKTPEYRIVEVKRDCLKPVRTASAWLLRLLLLGLAVGILIYNQYALSSAVKAVNDLKRDLLLNQAEYPIKKMLDGRTGWKLSELQRIRVTKLIAEEAIAPSFTLDLIRRESSFDPKAVSSQGAIGLMQLLPSTAEWLAKKEGLPWYGKEMLFDPIMNVRFGLAYLKYLAPDSRGEKTLRAAYQIGPNALKQRVKKEEHYARNP